VRAGFNATRSIHGPYEIDFRIMIDRKVRWISARGQGSDAGIVGRIMLGIFLDVTGRKQVEEANELLAGEMRATESKTCWRLRRVSGSYFTID